VLIAVCRLGGGAASKYTSRNCAGHASHTGE